MRAALYARYSSDKQREASIADQFYSCERAAERLGFMVVLRFEDKAITGTHRVRPGYQLMLDAAGRGDFDVLIVDDLSRLSRDSVETQQIIREFKYRRQRVIAISDGFDSNDKSYKLQAGVRGIVNDIYIDDLRAKTHRGLSGKARAGKSTGGIVYGYKRKPIIDHSRKDEYGRPLVVEVDRDIDPEQAHWVVKIFEWFAEGHPPIWIAAKLNELGIPSPRGNTWARSAIYGDMKRSTGLLNNELYIGKMLWNRREWVKGADGKRKPLMRNMSEYVAVERQDLRIISDELWQAKCERQKSIRQKTTRLQQSLAKSTGAGPKYLFSGLLKCGCCGSNYTIIGKTYYGCARHRDRGIVACSNDITVKKDIVEDVLLKGIKDGLFSDEATKEFLRDCNAMMSEIEASHTQERKELEKRVKQLEAELRNLVGFIKVGTALPSIVDEIKQAEDEKRRLEILLRNTNTATTEITNLVPHAIERYREIVEHLGNIRPEQVSEARERLKEITGGEIVLKPFKGDGLTAEVHGNYASLIASSSIMLVAGARYAANPTVYH